jgi:putative transposase
VKQIYISHCYQKAYIYFMEYVVDYLDHPQKAVIEQRVEILKFFDEFGTEATKRAFKKSRSTIFLWKQKLAKAGGKLSVLAPGNRAPKHKRTRLTHPFITKFIIDYRTKHPGVDKTTIAPVLRSACEKIGAKPVSESTVGRIIHDLKKAGRLPKPIRISLNGRTGKLYVREPKHPAKKTRRKGFYPRLPGELVEIDTVDVFVDGLKRYLITAIDLPTRFAFAYIYKSGSSNCARDFLDKLLNVAPFSISRIQTDNGHEFLKHFVEACQKKNLIHYFNYPRHPQSNAHLERFNRTIQEQFAYWHTDELDEPAIINHYLMAYLLWYNTEKPHRSIGKLPPLRYYLDNFVADPNKSNMYWTLTGAFIFSFQRLYCFHLFLTCQILTHTIYQDFDPKRR